MIGMNTARYNSTLLSKRNVPSSVTGDVAKLTRLQPVENIARYGTGICSMQGK